MRHQVACAARLVVEYAPEQREAAQEFCKALTQARTDRRVFAQLLTDAFIRGMDAQEQMSAGECLRPNGGG